VANILAIDQGTSSTKALVVADGGRVLGEGSATVHPEPGPGGAVEQDPEELLQSIITAGKAAVADAGEPVAAVGLVNQGETVLRWDRKTGRTLGPALSWQDRRAAPIARELETKGERLTEITGLPLDPYFAAPKMTWLRRETGDEGVITMIDAWLNQQIAGASLPPEIVSTSTFCATRRYRFLPQRTGSKPKVSARALRSALTAAARLAL
jgi:glycerol kinase